MYNNFSSTAALSSCSMLSLLRFFLILIFRLGASVVSGPKYCGSHSYVCAAIPNLQQEIRSGRRVGQ